MPRSWWPSGISLLRLAGSPGIVFIAHRHQATLFWVLLSGLLLTDALDGLVARSLDAVTEIGRRIDSWADYCLVIATTAGAGLLWPIVVRHEAGWIALALSAYFAPTAWALLRWRIVPYLHTWASKGMAVMMGGATVLLLAGGVAWPFRLTALLQVVVAAEEISILHTLPGRSGTVSSLWHARRIAARSSAGQA